MTNYSVGGVKVSGYEFGVWDGVIDVPEGEEKAIVDGIKKKIEERKELLSVLSPAKYRVPRTYEIIKVDYSAPNFLTAIREWTGKSELHFDAQGRLMNYGHWIKDGTYIYKEDHHLTYSSALPFGAELIE